MADYDIGSAFAQIEDELIASMARNLKRHTVEEAAEGYEWAQWQALQLQALEDYKRRAAAKYGAKFSSINDKIEKSITASYNTAQTQQEKEILRRIQSGIPEAVSVSQGTASVTGEFFKTNDRKLEALVKATTNDMQRAETAVLRMTNDKYRSIIFNAQVYANTGAGTYKKAVDMATKDFLAAGINCIEYKNGRRVNIKSYAEMALRTANKRAYLQGEGEMRKKWGIHTVILNKRTNACPKCSRFVGQVIVDDVWSGGTAQEAQKGGYLLMSECINEGLYHPNCQDSHTTYFGDILDDEEPQDEQGEQEEPDTGNEQEPINEQSKPAEQPFTPEEQQLSEQLYQAQQRENYCQRQTERFERLSKYSLDEGNVREYKARTREWEERLAKVKNTVEELQKVTTETETSDIGRLINSITGKSYKNIVNDFLERLPHLKNRKIATILQSANERVVYGKSARRNSYFNAKENKVYLSDGTSISTVAHELFHKIDSDYNISVNGTFDKCITNDYSNLVKAAKQSGQNLEDMLYLKYPEAFVRKGRLKKEYRGISDILNGMSMGVVDLGYGHAYDYWKNPIKLSKETFAQYGRMYFEENVDVFNMLIDIFPETTSQIETIINVVFGFGG